MENILYKDINIEENTFIFLLHEKNVFDTGLFQEYMERVGKIDVENTKKEDIIAIIEINDYIVRSVVYHFLPEDMFRIENFPNNMGNYIEQLRIENERLLRIV